MSSTVLGVLASGRGSNAQAIIDAIEAGQLPARIGVIISDNKQAAVLERAAAHNIPYLCLERSAFASKQSFEEALAQELLDRQVELVVLAGFMRLLSTAFINKFAGPIMNIHPSLLPAFPGLDAQGQAVRYGVKVSGCTVHFIDEGMDTGPIILQQPVPVLPEDTAETLAQRILKVEHQLYPQAIKLFCEGKLSIDGRRVFIRQS